MEGRFYFILLILSVILAEEICASLEKSFDTHIRKKRLINHGRSRIAINSIHQVPHIVQITYNGKAWHCSGNILSPIDIITAGHCVAKSAMYQVLSNSIVAGEGIFHNITHIKVHEQYNPQLKKNDLAMLKISPAIDFVRSGNRPIALHVEGDPITTLPVTSGWGCISVSPVTHKKEFPRELQSIILPVISENLCKNLYPHVADKIDDKLLCTRDPHGMKSSCSGDSGNPLVASNRLLGILSFSASVEIPHYPDVFMKVYNPEYAQWINNNKHHRD